MVGGDRVNSPEILEIRTLFAANDNATAVTRVRFYLDQLSKASCEHRSSGECPVCAERARITADIRALLPPLGEEPACPTAISPDL